MDVDKESESFTHFRHNAKYCRSADPKLKMKGSKTLSGSQLSFYSIPQFKYMKLHVSKRNHLFHLVRHKLEAPNKRAWYDQLVEQVHDAFEFHSSVDFLRLPLQMLQLTAMIFPTFLCILIIH